MGRENRPAGKRKPCATEETFGDTACRFMYSYIRAIHEVDTAVYQEKETKVITAPDNSRAIDELLKTNATLQFDLSRAQDELEHVYKCREEWQEGVLVRDTQICLSV